MIPTVEGAATKLRSTEPATRIDGARALADLVRAHGLDALPALLASIDAAAIEFPGEGRQPVKDQPRPYALYEPLHEGWRAAATGDAEVAHEWYAALLDRIESADPTTAARVLHVLTQDPWTSPSGQGSPYGPLLAPHAERVLGLLRRFAEAGMIEASARLLLAVRQQATRQDPIMAELAELVPALLVLDAAGDPDDMIELILDRHPDPLGGLAALLGALPHSGRYSRAAYPAEVRPLLVTTGRVDLPALAARLRPHAERWTDEQLHMFVEDVLFDTDEGLSTADANERPPLPVALRRAPATRAIPEMLLGLGRSTSVLRRLATTLADALTPMPAAAPPDPGVEFADDNLKFVVINHLMYERSVLTPEFDRDEFLKNFDAYEIEDNGYCEEIADWFRALPLTPAHLALVTELDIDATLEIWSQIDEGWGGEEDYFSPKTYVDVALLPNLEKIMVDCMFDEDTDLSALTSLRQRGVQVTIED